MSRETWRLYRSSKRFYVSTFRRAGTFLIGSVSLNLIFGLLIVQQYLNQPERQYYATNGATPPVELISMDLPNYTSLPLLANDQVSDNEPKVVPQ